MRVYLITEPILTSPLQDETGPHIWQSRKLKENGRIVAGWVDPAYLRGALGAAYWQEEESKWVVYRGIPGARISLLPNPPVVLLRRPDIVGVFGLGEVLEWLENQREMRRVARGDTAISSEVSGCSV